ncbi:MlaE family ABC transporter permease [Pseudomonas aeruginosa]|uniref:MlaE family ABC transporter permease n=1 Tax=Pseudomonas aeruginosa TaxID=287 RepID=UPI003749DBDF
MSDASQAWLRQDAMASGHPRWLAGGDWTIEHYASLAKSVSAARISHAEGYSTASLDWTQVQGLDTAGAALLVEILGPDSILDRLEAAPNLSPDRVALIKALAAAATAQDEEKARVSENPLLHGLGRIGLAVEQGCRACLGLVGFVGQIIETWIRTVRHPRRWRTTSVIAQIQRSAVDAIPIVALLSFMVGMVVAFLGATVLANFGASIFSVHLVTFSFMREFGVLLPAILIAGRTASAYTAQIGSMKANEEIDALRSNALDPIELLVVPRVLALLVSLPLLTLVGILAGIAGGATVCALSLEIPPTQFFAIVQDKIEVRHFLVGLSKSPLFALMIAAIGCHEGFKVAGSAESVGDRTTSSVVQSIFMVILIDAIAALFFMEMGW